MKIGFAGLGNMGGRLASRLVGIGDLTVYDAYEPSREAFRDRAHVAGSIAEVGAGADVVGVCVRTGEQVRECADALLPVMQEGSMLMIHSTISPDLVLTLAQEGAARGVEVIDAPVTVTRYGVPDGPFVCTMIGADETDTERVRPLLDAYATEAVHVGRLGAGMSLKIINNLVTLVQITVAEEAFRLAALAGVPAEALTRVTTQNGALTPTMKVIAARAGAPPADRETCHAREVQARNGVKDLALAEALAHSLDTPSAAASFARGQYYHAYTANLPEARPPACGRLLSPAGWNTGPFRMKGF